MIGYDSIEHASGTDVGVRRSHNQDAHRSLLASDDEQWRDRGHIFLVADGMGAHAVGELASDLAATIIPHTYHKHAVQEGVPALRKAFVEANASIHAKGQQNPEFGGMGTTTTALLLRPEGAWVGHVGDSRAYRVRRGKIEQLSFDHSLVWEMAKRQGVDPDSLEGIPSNVIVRSLGPEPLVQVDVEGPHPIEPGDVFILCSDGLSGPVSDSEIGAVATVLPPAEACRFLIDLANVRGGPDNITSLIVRVKDRSQLKRTIQKTRAQHVRGYIWPVCLVAAVCLASYALVLKANQSDGSAMLIFTFAAITAIGGMAAFFANYQTEKAARPAYPLTEPLHIYRSSSCHIDRTLVNKIAKGAESLEHQIREKKLEVDWAPIRQQLELASKLLAKDDWTSSFREYCRSMHLLAQVLQNYRPKGEVFQPVWDKQKASR